MAVAARLEPADALESDDRIVLALDPLVPLAVQVLGACAGAAEALLAAHPMLQPVPQGPAALRVWCGAGEPVRPGPPTLWLPAGRVIATAASPLRWSVPGPHPRLAETEPLIPLDQDPVPAGDTLLSAGGHPLVIEQTGSRRLIGRFDTGPAGAGSRSLPLLLEWLLARLAGRDLLFPVAAAARPAASTRVAPGALPAAAPAGGPPGPDRPRIPLWPLPLVGAVALLWLDLRRLREAARQ